jgi:hypothetical protein
VIHSGGNSGFGAVGLCVQWGASRVVLLGYDMQRTGNRAHWHGDHPGHLGQGNSFAMWTRRFASAAPQLVDAGIEVVNASRATALTCFQRMGIQEALCTS